MPKVTIAVPCYNGERFIAKTIEALLTQTMPAERILLIDDGSSDGSANIIRQYPVTLISHPSNQGLSQARNTALAHVDTDLIAYVDADAFAEPSMLEKLLNVFNIYSADGVGGRGVETVQESIFDRWRALHAVQGHGNKLIPNCQHLFGLCMAYKTSVLKSVGGFDTSLRTNAEDLDIGYRLNDAGFRLVYSPEAIVNHQRKDNHESLRRMMHQWYYWAFLVKCKNKRNPWSLLYGSLKRLLWADTFTDLFVRNSFSLVKLDYEMTLIKIKAFQIANRDYTNMKK